MIITKTPFRISFVGGGTDLREFYKDEFGHVLSSSIDQCIYVVVKKQTEIVEFKYRINWSKVEFKQDIADIEHPIVRECLRKLDIDFPLEITTFADIPAQSGLGSSSSFTVGLLKALYALLKKDISNYDLANLAAEVEVDILKRNMGKQDHFAAAYGGLNAFKFLPDESTEISKIELSSEALRNFSSNLLLFYTGQTRNASVILKEQTAQTKKKFQELKAMKDLVPIASKALEEENFEEFAKALNINWELKRNLTSITSNNSIDKYYDLAIKKGALGGKLLGAGGGGFLCFYVEQNKKNSVVSALTDLYFTKFNLSSSGSEVIFNMDRE